MWNYYYVYSGNMGCFTGAGSLMMVVASTMMMIARINVE